MPVDAITRLNDALGGRYRVERELGEGGMATVFLARDLKHERKVALKVLKPELAAVVGAERFLAEIRTTANLQHPHVLPLYDSGEADGLLFYTMPYVSGESLRQRLEREHQLPVEEAVRIAADVAEALDYAHREGVIHRDIKPANVLLQDGRPVISDFGIALALGAAGGGRLTETGLSLGTPHYMSPEQATGDQIIGPATDIYALGCVLYEMLVGAPPYTGSSMQAVLGRIVTGETPSARADRATVPTNVDAVIARALEKVPADRFSSAAELSRALRDPEFRHGSQPSEVGRSRADRWRRVALGAGFVAIIFAALWIWGFATRGADTPTIRYQMDFPSGQELSGGPHAMALSPDGNLLVYAGPGPQLWLRERDRLSGRPVDGTESGVQVTFSPEGRRLAFITEQGELKVVSLSGGPPRVLVAANARQNGLAWSADRYVYFTLEPSLGLHRVPDDGGGEPEELTRIVETGSVQDGQPEALPGSRGILFGIGRSGMEGDVAAFDSRSGEVTILTPGRTPRYADSGHLVFGRSDGSLYAAPFDETRLVLTGPAVPIVSGLTTGSADVDLSADGRLVYRGRGTTQPMWVDRDGIAEPVDPSWLGAARPDVSPDGSRVVFESGGDIWIKTLPDGAPIQLTFDGASMRPAWSPDGESVTFISRRGGNEDLWTSSAVGGEVPRRLLDDDRRLMQAATSPDGRSWVFRLGVLDERDLYWADAADPVPRPFRATPAAERAPTFSPDGRWVAYVSDESGQDEIYVLGFPSDANGPERVSIDGGNQPLWSNGGSELFYVNRRNEMVVVQVVAGETFYAGAQDVLFSMSPYGDDPNHRSYDVSHDDRRFLIWGARAIGGLDGPIVVENFFRELERLVPN